MPNLLGAAVPTREGGPVTAVLGAVAVRGGGFAPALSCMPVPRVLAGAASGLAGFTAAGLGLAAASRLEGGLCETDSLEGG